MIVYQIPRSPKLIIETPNDSMDKFIPFLSLICNAAWNTIEFAIEFDHVAYVEFHLMLNKTNFLD